MTNGDLAKSPKQPTCPFPELAGKEEEVGSGEYKILEGSDAEIVINPISLIILPLSPDTEPSDLIEGVHNSGLYTDDYNKKKYPVVSFLYHKHNSEGELESTERVLVLTGIGYGEHPGHLGQPPTWYLIGADVGRIDPSSGDFRLTEPGPEHGMLPKSFSLACITNGPFGDPILANQQN